jgi:hypothetical protein
MRGLRAQSQGAAPGQDNRDSPLLARAAAKAAGGDGKKTGRTGSGTRIPDDRNANARARNPGRRLHRSAHTDRIDDVGERDQDFVERAVLSD